MKKLAVFFVVVFIVGFVAAPAMAGGKVAKLYLYEKDPSSGWSIVDGGAWGKMKYNLAGPTFDFVFNGHDLEPGNSYTLLYYPDPWPGEGPGVKP